MAKRNDNGVEQLVDAVAQLSKQVQMLTDAVEELREEMGWSNRNPGAMDRPLPQRMRVTSMSKDPTAADFQVNGVDESTIERLRRKAAGDKPSEKPGRLF